MLALRNRLESGLKAISPHAVIFGEAAGRLPNTTLFAVEGMKAETAVIAFDLEGIAVSSGAACSSGKVQPSHVLAAMEISPALVRGAVRVSLGLEHRRGRCRTLSCRSEKAALYRGHSIAA
jgi:cysteine desulfurase